MKRILSLFLSMVLVFSMITGTVFVEAASGEPIKLVKVAFDMTNRNDVVFTNATTSTFSLDGVVGISIRRRTAGSVNLDKTTFASTHGDVVTNTHIGSNINYTDFKMPSAVDNGKVTVTGKFYQKGLKSSNINFRGTDTDKNLIISKYTDPDSNYGKLRFAIEPEIWYEFKYIIDLEKSSDNLEIYYTCNSDGDIIVQSSAQTFNSDNYSYVRNNFTLDSAVEGAILAWDDICMVHDTGLEKAKITSVGSDGSAVIPHSQNKVQFTLDKEIEGLTKDHILVKNAQGAENKATEITITSDATAPSDAQWIVEATLEQDLTAWTDYNVVISKSIYAGYKEVSGSGFIDVTDIAAPFSTPSAPIDIKAPDFSNDGSATTDVISTIGNTDMTFVYTNTASGGYIKEIVSDDFSVNGTLNGASISFNDAFADGDTAKLFVIKGWNNPVPLFNKFWAEKYDGSIPEAEAAVATSDAASGEMTFGAFDYDNKKMTVNLNVGSDAGATDGILYIYKRGTALKDNLIYADYVTTAANGSLAKEITFAPDIDDTTGEYTAAFYAEGIVIDEDFAIYDSSSARGGNIVKADLDTVGRNYDIYSGELTNWALTKVRREKNATDETAFSLTFPAANAADQASMRISITPAGGRQFTGRHIVKFKFFADKADADGYVDFEKGYFTINRDTKSSLTDGSYSIDGIVKANKWYDIEIVFELDIATPKSTINVVDIETGTSVLASSMNIVDYSDGQINGFRNIWAYLTYTASDDGHQMVFKDIQMFSDYGEEKPVIRYIENDNVVPYGQNELVFKISKDLGLTKDDISVVSSQGEVIKAKEILSVTPDMGEYIITAKMEKSFASWSGYTLNIDLVGYENYRELENGKYVAVKPISRNFKTPNAPIDMRDPEFTSSATPITASSYVANTSGSAVDVNLILTVCGSDGFMDAISSSPYNNIPNGTTDTDMPVSVSASIANGDTAKLFVIENWANPVPVFNKYWASNYDGSVPAAAPAVATDKAPAKSIVLDTFDFGTKIDHDTKKVVVNLNAGTNAPTDGVLYIYEGTAMSDGNLPIFADYITTTSNGTIKKEITLPESITNNNGSYTVAFHSNTLTAAITAQFNVYKAYDTASQTGYKENYIYTASKAASTAAGLKQIILGIDSSEKVVNTQWDIFSEDARLKGCLDDYNSVKNKDAVFNAMTGKLASLNSYDQLLELFKTCARAQLVKENTTTPAPSRDNSSFGGSSVAMKDTSPEQSTTASSAVFTDMTGHWAEEFAVSLYNRGIMKGYPDASFRGENSITRAELAKTLVESFEIATGSSNSFADVASSDWFASYVAGAAASGVVTGYEDGTFAPNNYITRQDAVLMLYRAMSLKYNIPEGYSFFADNSDIADYAYDAIRCLGEIGIVKGDSNGNFNPINQITRAEVATIICRALDYIEAH